MGNSKTKKKRKGPAGGVNLFARVTVTDFDPDPVDPTQQLIVSGTADGQIDNVYMTQAGNPNTPTPIPADSFTQPDGSGNFTATFDAGTLANIDPNLPATVIAIAVDNSGVSQTSCAVPFGQPVAVLLFDSITIDTTHTTATLSITGPEHLKVTQDSSRLPVHTTTGGGYTINYTSGTPTTLHFKVAGVDLGTDFELTVD